MLENKRISIGYGNENARAAIQKKAKSAIRQSRNVFDVIVKFLFTF